MGDFPSNYMQYFCSSRFLVHTKLYSQPLVHSTTSKVAGCYNWYLIPTGKFIIMSLNAIVNRLVITEL